MKCVNGRGKISGLAAPLFSLCPKETENAAGGDFRGARGEFPDLLSLGRLAQKWGMKLIQLLPLNDTGAQTSPYSALSAFALHPLYLRIRDLPEFQAARLGLGASSPYDSQTIANPADFTRYHSQKLDILREVWKAAGAESKKEVEAFCAAHDWIVPYSCFVELKRRNDQKPWWEWGEYRDPDKGMLEELWSDDEVGRDCRFWAWLQLRSFEQCSAASRAVMDLGVDIMGDIPILMNFDSADVWFERGIFQTDSVAGAPPDMYSRLGQNWGFPLYNWEVLEETGYSFWKERLAYAENFYSMFRIDHVLGFFRIWAIGGHEDDGFIGRFIPQYGIAYPELAGMDFSPARIKWLSRPHVPLWALEKAEGEAGYFDLISRGLATEEQVRELRNRLFEQVGEEPLFLFQQVIRGGKDISDAILGWSKEAGIFLHDEEGVRKFIDEVKAMWRNRALYEFEPGYFVPTWEFKNSSSWQSLNEKEKGLIEALVARRNAESQTLWEKTGRKILSAIIENVDMSACAEDLGAVPPCVPLVLGELGIPGLRVLRWTREWGKADAPYIPFSEYPENSVACTSVHDSTNLRQWWKEEADRVALWPIVVAALGARGGAGLALSPPDELEPDAALAVLTGFSAVASRILVFPIQDLLAASPVYRELEPSDERINTPGTLDGRNWLYRMKTDLETLLADTDFSSRVASVSSREAVRR